MFPVFVAGAALLLFLARSVARVARGLLFGFQSRFRSFLFRLKTAGFCRGLRREFGFARQLFNPGSLAQLLRLRARSGLRLPLGSLLQDRRIIRARLGLELLENALSGVLRGGLPIRKTWLLKTHRVDIFLFGMCWRLVSDFCGCLEFEVPAL